MKYIITDIEDLKAKISGEYEVIGPSDKLTQCMGCFGCWLKTPGECVIKDGFEHLGAKWQSADEIIIVSECCYGWYSPFVKNIFDRSLAYVLPDFTYRRGEMHHPMRYSNSARFSVYLYGADITEAEKKTAAGILEANCDNFCGKVGRLEFLSSKEETEGLAL